VFSFGDAKFYGSTGAIHLARPIIGMTATADGKGYWLYAGDGGVFPFGGAPYLGALPQFGVHPRSPIVAVAAKRPPPG
jgi:hypothetical protein